MYSHIFKLFIHLYFGCTVSLLLRRVFSSSGKRGQLSGCGVWTPRCGGSLLQRPGSRVHGLLQFPVAAAPRLQSTGSVAVAPGLRCPEAHGLFQDQDQTCVFFNGRLILYHQAIRVAQTYLYFCFSCSSLFSDAPKFLFFFYSFIYIQRIFFSLFFFF